MPWSRVAALFTALAAIPLSGCYNWFHRMPNGTSFAGMLRSADDVHFFADTTWIDDNGKRHVDQQIFDAVFEVIARAEKFIVVDMFLWNDFQGDTPETARALSSELTDALLTRKQNHPEMTIVVISDPVNTVYGGIESTHFSALREAGIPVVITRLDRLRDSNPGYSGLWRIFAKPLGQPRGGTLPSPFGDERVGALNYLSLLNFKANHRKVIIADGGADGAEVVAMVISANPHDGSSAHGNVGIGFSGVAAADLLQTEKAVIAFSDGEVPMVELSTEESAPDANGGASLQVVTEGKIRIALLETLEGSDTGDRVDVAIFYLSDHGIVEALAEARARGASVRVLMDPNKDAFGYEKSGIPNRPVAVDLRSGDVTVRWCDTHGEQCHAKLMLVRKVTGEATLIMGSANFTRRNLQDLNLETDVVLRGTADHSAIRDAAEWFELIWGNAPGKSFSVDYEIYKDESLRKRFKYQIEERSGMSTF